MNKEVIVAGMVTEARNGTTKTGKPFGSLTVQDYTDSFSFMMFDKDYVEYSKYFTPGLFCAGKGKVQKRRYKEEELEVKVSSINLLTSVREEMIKSLSLIIPIESINDKLINELMDHSRESKGSTELKFIVVDPVNKISLQCFQGQLQ